MIRNAYLIVAVSIAMMMAGQVSATSIYKCEEYLEARRMSFDSVDRQRSEAFVLGLVLGVYAEANWERFNEHEENTAKVDEAQIKYKGLKTYMNGRGVHEMMAWIERRCLSRKTFRTDIPDLIQVIFSFLDKYTN